MTRGPSQLARDLGAGSLASVAYGEIGASLYFALGVVAAYALGLTPWVLLAAGLLFLVVSLSYAEGTAALAEPGGAATFVRRAFNDPAGFATGWLLFLDYVIVIALAALFVPHYLGEAVRVEALTKRPFDMLVGFGVIAAVAGARLLRRTSLYGVAQVVAAVAFAVHLALIVFGLAFVFSLDGLGRGADPGAEPSWRDLAFALPLAMLAFTGLETVANLAADVRRPGRSLPRGLFGGIAAVGAVSLLLAVVGLSAYPPSGGTTALGAEWLRAPLVGIAEALPDPLDRWMSVVVGLSGVLVLTAAVATSFSGAGRLALALGRYDMLPHAFADLSRRSLLPPVTILSTAGFAVALLALAWAEGREVRFLAGLYSFGILTAFTAAQLAVVRLRVREPELERPFRAPWMPALALAGAVATGAALAAALVTHESTRIAGLGWLVLGAVVFVAVRRREPVEVLGRARGAVADLVPAEEGTYERILVPLKLGGIGEEVLGTALRLAEERRLPVLALHVIAVPLDLALDAPLPDEEGLARAALAEVRALAAEHDVPVETRLVRARTIGQAIVEQARSFRADLVVVGSSPRWRRHARFFSPTVDYVLRKAPGEVMVVAYPEGIFDDEQDSSDGSR